MRDHEQDVKESSWNIEITEVVDESGNLVEQYVSKCEPPESMTTEFPKMIVSTKPTNPG